MATETTDVMDQRICRFEEIREHPVFIPFIDAILPGHLRAIYPVIGDAASEDDTYTSRIAQPHKFGLAFVEAPPMNGPAWHTHEYCELFIPLTGTWRFTYGHDAENPDDIAGEAVIGPWDVISFPDGLWRRFRNESDTNSWALAILDPHEPFSIKDPIWPKWLVKQAAEDHGLKSDERGRLIKPSNFADLERGVRDHIASSAGPVD